MRLTVTSLKGGTGKTTTAAHLAAGLSGSGLAGPSSTVVAVDADPQGSLLRWAERADWPSLTEALPTRTIHTSVPKLMAGVQHLVIDTPPGGLPIIASALKAADLVLVPVQPSTADLDQMAETMTVAADATALTGAQVVVLLTRVVPRTRARVLTRAALVDSGHLVLESEVRQSQSMALAHGRPITELGDYATVLDELTSITGHRKKKRT